MPALFFVGMSKKGLHAILFFIAMNISDIKKDVRYWQRMLRAAGYYTGLIDGVRGPLQRAAELAWQHAADEAKYALWPFDARSEENIATLLPSVQRQARQWLAAACSCAGRMGVGVRIICGTRSYAEQNALFAQGRTAAGPRVTNARAGYSWHNFGLAWDFGVFSPDFKTYFGNHAAYETLGELARDVEGLEWGGDWTSFQDLPHIQARKYVSLAVAREDF